jgi:hypothetical protein
MCLGSCAAPTGRPDRRHFVQPIFVHLLIIDSVDGLRAQAIMNRVQIRHHSFQSTSLNVNTMFSCETGF